MDHPHKDAVMCPLCHCDFHKERISPFFLTFKNILFWSFSSQIVKDTGGHKVEWAASLRYN